MTKKGHFDADSVAKYIDGIMQPKEKKKFEAHMEICQYCRYQYEKTKEINNFKNSDSINSLIAEAYLH